MDKSTRWDDWRCESVYNDEIVQRMIMARMVKCMKLGVEAEGLDAPPFPGVSGQRVYDHISKQAWKEWMAMQTMIINERRLASFDPAAKKILEAEREKFLFAGGFEMPEGYVPQKG